MNAIDISLRMLFTSTTSLLPSSTCCGFTTNVTGVGVVIQEEIIFPSTIDVRVDASGAVLVISPSPPEEVGE